MPDIVITAQMVDESEAKLIAEEIRAIVPELNVELEYSRGFGFNEIIWINLGVNVVGYVAGNYAVKLIDKLVEIRIRRESAKMFVTDPRTKRQYEVGNNAEHLTKQFMSAEAEGANEQR